VNPDIYFSIIIPAYNRGNLIVTTIQSALNQAISNFEVIIVDDGSTDNTEEVVRAIKDHRLFYFKKENAERASARNFGATKSRGQYLSFVDSDDLLYPDYLSNAFESIKRFRHPPFVHLAYEVKNEKGIVKAKIDRLKSDTYQFLISGNPLSCLGIFIRKDIFSHHHFNEDINLSGTEDWELWLRLVANYGIKTDNRISAALITHSDRSVLNADEMKLLNRKNLAFKYAFTDQKVRNKFEKSYIKMQSHFDSYISLHLALAGKRRRALHYLREALKANPVIIFQKRFIAIIKYLISKQH
jgi:glycosyltransferase involved in cell wall biosynthesis